MQENNEIKLGANVIDGQITYKAVAEAFDLAYTPVVLTEKSLIIFYEQ